jgi:hypothetical protein
MLFAAKNLNIYQTNSSMHGINTMQHIYIYEYTALLWKREILPTDL